MALNLPGKAHPIYGNFEDRPQDTEDLIMISLITKKNTFIGGDWSAFRMTLRWLLQTRVFVEAGESEQ